CDRVAIMDHGRVIALGSPAELVAALDAEQIVEFAADAELEAPALAALPGVSAAARRNGAWRLSVRDMGAALPALLAELERRGAALSRLATHQATLEDVFVHLTGRELRDG
nr:DUF4162 domain-containing protein [Acidobacteriota bacterium]